MAMVGLGRLVACAFAFVALTPAQYVDLRLPTARHISLVVRDENGNPVSEATLGHAGGEFQR